jgi:succinate dehydrogenase hydrophobic anchor subunit
MISSGDSTSSGVPRAEATVGTSVAHAGMARVGVQQAGVARSRRSEQTAPGTGASSRRPHMASGAIWIAMRGTGLLLSVLVLGHLLFVHLLTDVSKTGASFVERRWSSTLWVVWDGTMLTAALLHGAIGVTTVIRDYTRTRLSRRTWLGFAYALSAALCGLGWYAIVEVVASAAAGH